MSEPPAVRRGEAQAPIEASGVRSVTLSVVSHGQRPLVENLVRDLAALPGTPACELILTLNLPEPEPEGLTRLAIPVTVLRNRRPLGFGANHNQAFRHCRTPAFAVLNPDLRLPDDPFPALLRRLAISDVGLVAPCIVDESGVQTPFARSLYTPLEIVSRKLGRASIGLPDPAWIAGTFMLLRSRAFDMVGGFDEKFHLYVEDVDLSARLRLAGWRLVTAADARVVHVARYASHRSLRHMRWHLASMIKFWLSRTFWQYRALLRNQKTRI